MAKNTTTKLTPEAVRDRIFVAKRFFEKKRKKEIETWNKLWIGDHYEASVLPQDRISVNYVYASIKQKVSALYYQNPKIIVNARKPRVTVDGQEVDNVRNARNVELVANWQKDEYPLKREIKKCLLDWKRFGYGVMFTGWKTDFIEEAKKKKEPRKLLGVIPFGEKEVDTGEVTISDLKDRPDFRRIRPNQIYFSPESDGPDDVSYVVIERMIPYEEVENDKRFKHTDRIPDNTYLSEDLRKDTVGTTEDMRRVRLYDYFDKDVWRVMADGLDDEFLYEKENPYKEVYGDEEALPIVLIFGDENFENFYPLSEIGLIEAQQRELNKIRSQQINHRKRFNRKYLYDKDILTSDEIEKLKNPEDGSLVGVSPGGQPLDSLVRPIQDADLKYPNDVEQRVKEDINVISGILQYQLGSSKEQFETLGQTQIAETHSQTRKDEEQEIVEEFVQKIYERLVQLDQAFLQENIVQRIVGEEGAVNWANLSNADIQGEFDVKVESGSQLKNDDDVLRKQFLDTFNLFYGKPEFMPVIKDLGLAILKTFPAMREVEEKLRQLPPPPPPPPEEKPVNVSISIPGEVLPPDAIGALAAKAVGSAAMPPQAEGGGEPPLPPQQGGGPINPELLAQGEPSQTAIQRGVNRVR